MAHQQLRGIMRTPVWLIAIVMMGLSSACNTSARSDPAISEAPPASEAESAVQAEQEVRQAHEDDLRRVSVYGDVAVLSGHSTSRVTDRVRQVAATEGYTEMWVRRGDWELVAEQITLQR
jgi:hypothetical protein